MRFLSIFLLSIASWAAVATQLPAAIDQFLHKQNVNPADVSIWVQEITADQPLVELNGTVLRSPASVTKLFTTGAGLFRLGADYRWQTRFLADALPDSHGVINGNLYIIGGGDPFLVQERLTDMLKGLRDAGVRHITGDIVLDESLYQLSELERDGARFDQAPWAAYNAIPDPLMVNFRTIKVWVSPKKGARPAVSIQPKMDNWRIDNQLQQVRKKGCAPLDLQPYLSRSANGYAVLHLTGRYTTGCGGQELTLVAGEGSEQFYYLFRDIWYRLGGSFDGGGRIASPPSTAKAIFTGYSDPLSDQIQKMNQYSNNVMTRQLFLTLGTEQFGKPGTLEKARNAVLTTLEGMGVPTAGMTIDNGSGLSRTTRVSAEQLATLLRKIYLSDKAEVFLRSLAVAGESGTLRKRYHNGVLAGNVYGKTGTIDNVRAFAGFVRSQSRRNYIVVIIGNGDSAVQSRALQDDIFRWVYQQ